MHPENFQLKSTLLNYNTDRFVYLGCIFIVFAPPKAEDCTPQKSKLYFCSLKIMYPSMIRSVFRLVSLLVS